MNLKDQEQTLWYISKYALAPKFGNPSRQFFFSKYFVKKGVENVYLISSRSVGSKSMPTIGNSNHIDYECDGVKGVLINGPLIKLGFNTKRLFSWLIFEIRVLYWALFLTKSRPDTIIVSSLSLLTFISGIILKKRFKCKLIVEVRDIWPLTLIEVGKWSKTNILIRFLSLIEKAGYKHADAIIGSMPNLKEHVKKILPDIKTQVYCIPMGYDPHYWSQSMKEDNITLLDLLFSQIPQNNFIVGYAGTIGQANCVNQIVAAAEILKDEPVSFILLGDGPDRAKLEKEVKILGLTEVYFVDSVPKNSVQSFLQKCNLLLNPWKGSSSIYRYGVSPNKWIDYMLSGKPILVPFDGYPSIINDSNCGLFIAPDDPKALAEAILDFSKMPKEKLEELGTNGRNFLSENLTYDVLSEKYLSVINQS